MRGVVAADRVEVPAAVYGIARARDRDALVEGRRAEARHPEVGDDPAVADGVVHDRRVALVVVVARGAGVRARPERVERERGETGTVALREDADRRVDGLDEMRRTDVAVRVGRPAGAKIRRVEPGKARRRCGNRSTRRRDGSSRLHSAGQCGLRRNGHQVVALPRARLRALLLRQSDLRQIADAAAEHGRRDVRQRRDARALRAARRRRSSSCEGQTRPHRGDGAKREHRLDGSSSHVSPSEDLGRAFGRVRQRTAGFLKVRAIVARIQRGRPPPSGRSDLRRMVSSARIRGGGLRRRNVRGRVL